jgi:hypothetical protein
MQYSPELIQRIKTYFNVNYGEALTDEQASERLDALGDLYQVTATGGAPEGPPAPD